MCARAATIVLEKLPTHHEYQSPLTTEQRHHLQTNGADILDPLSKLKPILQDGHDQWTRTHPDEPNEPDPLNATRSQSSFSSYDRQSIDRERQQRDSAREASRIEREDRDRQRFWGGSGTSYGPTPAANAAAASAVAAARQAATSSPDDSRQRQQEYLQREEQRQRQRVPDYDRLRQEELRNRQAEERRRETDAVYNAQASSLAAPFLPPTNSLPSSIYGSSSTTTSSGLSMPTPSTSVTSALSIPVSSSYSSGASCKDFPQAASVPSSNVYHPPPVSQPNLYPGQSSQSSSSYISNASHERPSGLADKPARYENNDSTDSDSTGNSLSQWRKSAKSRQEGPPPRPPSRSPSTYPPPITTTSPPPADHIEYPQLMTQHQQTQGYRPIPKLHVQCSNLYSTDLLPPPPSSIPPAGMPYPSHHQRQQSQSTYRDPSPNPSSSYANRPPPPVPAQPPPPPRREERTSRNSSPPAPELKTVLLPRESLARFLTIAKVNMSRNRETCGLLLGRAEGRKYVVTTLLILKQHSTSDTCAMDEEELVLQFTEERGLITLGWIHTHPTQSCFMSSVDLHTHSGFQCMLPESFAVVCAPQSNPNVGIFRLTDPPGLQTILRCNAKEAFHPHPDLPIYTDADKGHVQMRDLSLEIVDIR
ncbi:hypothetical protein VKT23_014444 [Stygiomarasmius scandens]|uniref:MPN domain-containing protein n=1 Tax=Marasmiellus scandens TaxID=2682957 RepID=A0ABR1J128_9AGAR